MLYSVNHAEEFYKTSIDWEQHSNGYSPRHANGLRRTGAYLT